MNVDITALNTRQFLSHLRSLGVQVTRKGDKLSCKAPKGVLTPVLNAELARRKSAVLAFLAQADQTAGSGEEPLRPIARPKAIPLTTGQRALWFLAQLVPDNPFYNIPFALRLSGPLQGPMLEHSLNQILRRHEVLRTYFPSIHAQQNGQTNGQPTQVVADAVSLSLAMIDLQDCPAADRLRQAQQTATHLAQIPFDLTQAPLLRATLIKLSPTDHVLVVVIHHILADGWSMGVFERELTTGYYAAIAGKPAALADLTVQYADFAIWQQRWLEEQIIPRHLPYWKQQLADLAGLRLPTDFPRPAQQSFKGGTVSLALPQSLKADLVKLGQQQGVTLFMVLLAAFKVLLHRYTQQTDIVVGTPVANRHQPEIEPLIGFFVNSLVLRTPVEADLPFLDLLNRVRRVTLDAYAHQELPFEKLVEALKPERTLDQNPLFQVMFTLQNAAEQAVIQTATNGSATPCNLEFSPFEVVYNTARTDLEWDVWEHPQGLRLVVDYAADLFTPATIQQMLGHYRTLLEGIVDAPDCPIGQLPLLSESQRRQLVVDWNRTAMDYPRHWCVADLFEAQVAQTPDRVAVEGAGERLTYAQLNHRANQLAHYLQTLGVKPDVLVGLCVDRSIDMVMGLLGVLKAGGGYVPLDPAFPQARLSYILEDAQVAVLLTQQTLQPQFSTAAMPTVCLDADWPRIEKQALTDGFDPSQAPDRAALTPHHLAYVIYTSGSTGKPKGVMIQQQALINITLSVVARYGLNHQERILQFASLSFDGAIEEIYPCFACGGTLVLRSEEMVSSSARFLRVCQDWHITMLELPTAYWHQLITDLVDQQLTLPPSLKLIVIAGEQALPEKVALWQQQVGQHPQLINAYGPTETTVTSTIWPVPADPVVPADRLVPIGRPLNNEQVYVLDADLQPLPMGVPGELYIGGDSLARGYLNRPEVTAASFVPDPFSPIPGARLYKTGDAVRYLPDGNLEFIGRIDYQVKVRGFRVELGEIEASLVQHPGVREAIVIAREERPGEKRLVAYVVAQANQALLPHDLRRFLKDRMPDYMVPSAFMVLGALPLTTSGKVNRQALPTPDYSRDQLAETYVAPRTPLEQTLTDLWASILRLPQVGIHDNFFALGGHSLLVTQLISRLRDQLAIEMAVRSVFEAPTPAELAGQIAALQANPSQGRGIGDAIVPRNRTTELPLSFAQARLWFLDQLTPDNPFYNVPLALHLVGDLNVAALEASLNDITRRHETLRTCFPAVGGQPSQQIVEDLTLSLSVVDLHATLAAQGPKASGPQNLQDLARQFAATAAQTPFDLTQVPLLRVHLLRLAPREHVLVIVMHHIISDAWSGEVFNRELTALYQAFVQGQVLPLGPLPIQYADFALWQRQGQQQQLAQTHLAYWQQQLADVSALQLPTDFTRPAVQSFRGATAQLHLPLSLKADLERLSQQRGTTLFMTLLAAFKVLLHRYTQQTDIVVGSPIANRNRSEIEPLIGFFVNSLVLRTQIDPEISFLQALDRVRDVTLGAYAHQDLPFEKLVEVLHPDRDLSQNPLFQVMFVMQNAPVETLHLGALSIAEFPFDYTITHMDLEWEISQREDGLEIHVAYAVDLFAPTTIQRLLEHYQQLLTAVVADPQQRVSDLPLLTVAERQRLLRDWNDTAVAYPQDGCVHQLFEDQAEKTPGAIALIFQAQRLTYQELNHRANQLAHYLQGLGVGPNSLVGICVPRSPDMIVGVLGILKAGSAYVPLDPAYPPERLALMIEDAALSVLLTQSTLLEQLPDHAATTLCLDTEWPNINQQTTHNPTSDVGSQNLAYLLFTSGSTGRPKGVAMGHAPLVNLIHWQRQNSSLPPEAKTLQFAPISFDVSFQDSFATLCAGGTLVLIPEELRLDAARLLQYLSQHRIERLFLPFVALQHLAEVADQQGAPPLQLREVITAGEQLQVTDAIRRWFRQMPDCTLHNQYGPTESHVVTALTLQGSPDDWPALPTIGRPIANAQIFVLDGQYQPVPIGVPGELYIGEASLAQGYLHRPDLTAERFVPHPFSPKPGDRLYKTGDLARYLADGQIEYLGRIDHQVKIRGFRIELGEVEVGLSQCPGVAEAVVLVREDTRGEKQLVAYVVAHPGQALTPSSLRRFLKDKMPDYMVPSAFVQLEAFPLTPSGKINRRALPAPEASREQSTETFVAGRTPLERQLTELWAQVLKLPLVGIHDNFFTLGGHSLLATQLISRIRDTCQCDLPVRRLFEAPTPAEFADYLSVDLRANSDQDTAIDTETIVPQDHTDALPLSFAQSRLWFLDQLEPGNAFYNLPLALRLQGPLQVAALEQSLNTVIRRHGTLRTCFPSVAGQPTQSIAEAIELKLTVVDLQHIPEATRRDEVRRLAITEIQQPFDLTIAPLFRVTLWHLSPTDHGLLVVMHHIITDGWSMAVFERELIALYNQAVAATPLTLTDLPIQYADFALWQQRWLKEHILPTQLPYWRQQLADLSPLQMPTDLARPAIKSFRGATASLQVPQSLSAQVNHLSQRQGVTLFMTLLSAFKVLLHRYTQQTDIVLGTPVANRNRSEIEPLIGFFVNSLVLRTQVEPHDRFVDLLAQVRQVTLDAYAYQDLPFEKLVEELQPERRLNQNPLFQVMFALQNTPRTDVQWHGLTVSPFPVGEHMTHVDLSWHLWEEAEGLRIEVDYAADLFLPATIDRMLQHFQILLEGIVADPHQTVEQLPLLSAQERHQILVDWNQTARPFDTDLGLHQLFEDQVEKTPEATAVICENQHLTYRELNTRANQLAHYLQSLGVETEVRVGICLDRSVEMMVALLGVLKAGGAYVPLDPTLPPERLAFIVQDSQISVLLTHSTLAPTFADHVPPSLGLRWVEIDQDWPTVMACASTPVGVKANDGKDGKNLAYVIYTSGSTGQPKGVAVEHRQIRNYVSSIVDRFAIELGRSFATVSTLAADLGNTVIFAALATGGTLHILPWERITDAQAFAEYLANHPIDYLKIVPSHLMALQEGNHWADVLPQRGLILGGEVSPMDWVKSLAAIQHCRIFNHYGPTETTVGVATYTVESTQTLPHGTTLPLGYPLANQDLYLLDAELNPVPVGVPGELYIGGAGVTRGYLNRPDLTAEKFIPHPFSQQAGRRLYKSGDLARYRPNGTLQFLGRGDDQVKIRGLRIELGEIASVLNQHPAIHQAVVRLQEPTSPQKRLVAYVVPGSGQEVQGKELQAFLQARLPDYMVPNAFVRLDALPLTANGKLDYKRLLAPSLEPLRDDVIAPQTPTERQLAEMWAALLSVQTLGLSDNFFDLGGHSLLTTQLVSRIRNEFGVDLSLRTVFEQPTLTALAQAIDQANATQPQALGSGSHRIPCAPRSGPLPLSFAQTRLWFLDQLEPDSASYNIPTVLRIEGHLNLKALADSLNAIVARHDVLRTNFVAQAGNPVQVIHPRRNLSLPMVDLRHLPPSEREHQAYQLAVSAAQSPFDLASEPLIRSQLIQLDQADYLLVLVMHHIVSDGWSTGVFIHELTVFYTAYCQGTDPALPPLPIQYADFSQWQRQWLLQAGIPSQLPYWQQQLKEAPDLLQLPTDRPRPAEQTFQGAYRTVPLSAPLTQALNRLSQDQGVTLFMTLVTAFNILLWRYTRQEDICIGTPIANRNRSELEDLIGFFVNTLVLRTQLSGNPSFQTLLAQVKEVALSAYAHQDIPFEQLVEELRPTRSLSYSPLFQVMFVLQNTATQSWDLPGLTVSQPPLNTDTAKFDLTLLMCHEGDILVCEWEYNTDLFDAATIDRMASNFQVLLEGIVTNPDQLISELPLLTEAERHQLLVEWTDTKRDYPKDKCIHQLFEAQVERTPDAVAVGFEDQRLTYRDLNERANQLAHHLQQLGVGTADLVGICTHRSIEMIVGLLGILKAGGAYVPLDPTYPTERLTFMLADTQVSVLLIDRQVPQAITAKVNHTVCLDTITTDCDAYPKINLTYQPTATSLAYVMYTSGSTGQPKGVSVLHQGVVRLVQNTNYASMGPDDRFLQLAPIAFDAATLEIWGALLNGAQVVLFPDSHPTPDRIAQVVHQHQITILWLTAGLFHVMVNRGLEELSSLRQLLAGGDVLSVPHVQQALAQLDTCTVINGYGPTENTTFTCCYAVPDTSVLGQSIPIGRPIANTEIYVLDPQMQPVPIGVSGELFIGGDGLATGYLNRPDLTAERFIPNPFSDQPDSRLYRTGDLVRYLADGNLEFLGRLDNQVKIRGFRIELGEIESVLGQQPQVRRTVVVTREDDPGDKRLVTRCATN